MSPLRGSTAPNATSGQRTPFFSSVGGKIFIVMTALALAAVAALGVSAYLSQRNALQDRVVAQLTSVADLKKEQITTWLQGRQADVRMIARNKYVEEQLTALVRRDDPSNRETELAASPVVDLLQGMKEARRGYRELSIADVDGTVVLSSNPALIGKPSQHGKAVQATLNDTDGRHIRDIHAHADSESPVMTFGHEIHAANPETRETVPQVIGVVYVTVEMDDTIYPLINAWPGMGGTGETLLVRAQGDATVFLNDLRHQDDAALNLSIARDADLARPAHRSSRGQEGVIVTPDYRDVPVVAAYRHIPIVAWGFVAKQDRREAFAAVRALGWRIGIVALVVFLMTGLVSMGIARTLTRPLERLVEGTAALAAGDWTTQIDSARRDELGGLARAFDEMASQLRQTLVGLNERVAELRNSEEALRQANEKLEALIHASPLPILVIDRHARVQRWSRAAEQVFGWTEEEVLGQLVPIVPDEDRPNYDSQVGRVMQGESLDGVEVQRYTQDGEVVDVSVWATPLRDEASDVTGAVSVVVDLTERKRWEQALQEAEEQFRDLYESAPIAYFSVGTDGVIKRCNRAAGRLMECSPERLVGRNVIELSPATPEGRERAEELFRQFRAGQGIDGQEVQMQTHQGSIVWVELTVQPKVDDDGNVIESQSMAVDITARKEAESRAEEAAILEERTRLARELHDSVAQSLYSVTLFAEASQRLIATDDDPDVLRSHVERTGESAMQALKELRLSVYELRPTELDKEGLIESLNQRLAQVEERAGVKTEFVVDGDVQVSKPAADRLYRIAQEALNNALKHADATSVSLQVRAKNGKGVELSVEDNGCGFEPASEDASPNGMGLSSMEERADQLNGELTVTSAPGQGTTVRVRVACREEG